MRLHCQAQGSGHPLIILHGFLGSLDNWQSMSRRLARHYQVHAVDLRNHGRSPHSRVMSYPIMAKDLDEFIAERALRAPYIMGHSMGGKVAMQFAASYPDKIGKLVVVDIAPKAYAPVHRDLLASLRAANLQAGTTFGEIDAALASTISDPALRRFLLKNLERGAALGFRWRLGLREIIENYDELTRAVALRRPVACPACFIRGGRSQFVQDEDLAAIRSAFPNSEFKTIAAANHWVHIDAPDEFFTIATNFLTPAGAPADPT